MKQWNKGRFLKPLLVLRSSVKSWVPLVTLTSARTGWKPRAWHHPTNPRIISVQKILHSPQWKMAFFFVWFSRGNSLEHLPTNIPEDMWRFSSLSGNIFFLSLLRGTFDTQSKLIASHVRTVLFFAGFMSLSRDSRYHFPTLSCLC